PASTRLTKLTPFTTRPALTSRQGMMRQVRSDGKAARLASPENDISIFHQFVGTRLRGLEIEGALVDAAPKDGAFHAFVVYLAELLDIDDAGNAARCEDGNAHGLRQAHGGLDVDAGQHAVAADVGVDDGFAAVVLELAGKVDDIVPGELAPAVGGHLAVARVQPHDDVAGEGAAGVVQEARILDGRRADDHVRDAAVEITLDGVQVADAAADLDRNLAADRVDNGADGGLVLGLARDRAVQVDEVQPARTGIEPALGHGGRVFGKDRGIVQIALAQASAAPVVEVNGGDEQQDG